MIKNLPLKNFIFSKAADLDPTTLTKTEHFHWHILIRLALI